MINLVPRIKTITLLLDLHLIFFFFFLNPNYWNGTKGWGKIIEKLSGKKKDEEEEENKRKIDLLFGQFGSLIWKQ